MKKVKILFAVAAAITGISTAAASNLTFQPNIKYDWMDWDAQIVLENATFQEAQALCVPTLGICLRATDNVFLYTTGYLPWGRGTKKTEDPKP